MKTVVLSSLLLLPLFSVSAHAQSTVANTPGVSVSGSPHYFKSGKVCILSTNTAGNAQKLGIVMANEDPPPSGRTWRYPLVTFHVATGIVTVNLDLNQETFVPNDISDKKMAELQAQDPDETPFSPEPLKPASAKIAMSLVQFCATAQPTN